MATADRNTRDCAVRRISTACGEITLRPETPDDDGFLESLFAANNEPILRLAAIPDAMIAHLLAFQHRSQTSTYRGLFPEAVYSIVVRDDAPIGRLIERDEGDAVYFVDFALLPRWQARGIGSALLKAMIDIWAERGRGARAKVLITNKPSLKMCERLGLIPCGAPEQGHQELRRRLASGGSPA